MINADEAGRFLRGFAPPDEFLQFIRALNEAGMLESAEGRDPRAELIYMLEKPWKWADEYVAWYAAGRPMDASESGWWQFAEAVEA